MAGLTRHYETSQQQVAQNHQNDIQLKDETIGKMKDTIAGLESQLRGEKAVMHEDPHVNSRISAGRHCKQNLLPKLSCWLSSSCCTEWLFQCACKLCHIISVFVHSNHDMDFLNFGIIQRRGSFTQSRLWQHSLRA